MNSRLVADDAELVAGRQRSAATSASRSLTSSTTSTVLVPDCLRICSSTVGSPLTLADVSRLGHAVLDARDVAQQHRVAVALADDDVAELVDRLDAAARAQRDRLRRPARCGRRESRRSAPAARAATSLTVRL